MSGSRCEVQSGGPATHSRSSRLSRSASARTRRSSRSSTGSCSGRCRRWPRPAELVTIRFQTAKGTGRYFMPYLDYTDLRDKVGAFAGMAASLPVDASLATAPGEDGSPGEIELVTTNYFEVLGATPAPGRDFMTTEEHTVDGTPPAIISHQLWQRGFDGDAAIIGRSLLIDGRPFTIVGVAPRGFQGRSLVATTDAWVPVGAFKTRAAPLRCRHAHVDGAARCSATLSPGCGRASRSRKPRPKQRPWPTARPISRRAAPNGTRPASARCCTQGLGHETCSRSRRLTTTFNLLMGAVGLILLLACANAANLLLARATARRREIAVCQAIGASRFRIVRQQLAEGLVLSVAAGGAGLALAAWLTSLFDGMKHPRVLPVSRGRRASTGASARSHLRSRYCTGVIVLDCSRRSPAAASTC